MESLAVESPDYSYWKALTSGADGVVSEGAVIFGAVPYQEMGKAFQAAGGDERSANLTYGIGIDTALSNAVKEAAKSGTLAQVAARVVRDPQSAEPFRAALKKNLLASNYGQVRELVNRI